MMELPLGKTCEAIIADLDGALGCAVVDVKTTNTLAVACHSEAALDATGMGLISVAAAEMFHGKLIRQFHRVWSGGQSSPERFVREVQLATSNSYQFMSVVPDRDDCLLVLITDKTVSLGLGWMSVHNGLARVAGAFATEQTPAVDALPENAARDPFHDGTPESGVPAVTGQPPTNYELQGNGPEAEEPPSLPPPSLPPPPPPPPPLPTPDATTPNSRQRDVAVGTHPVAPPEHGVRETSVRAGPRAKMFVPRRL